MGFFSSGDARSSSVKCNRVVLCFLLMLHLVGFGGHDAVQLRCNVLGEAVDEGQDGIAIEQQTFAFAGVLDVGELIGGNAQLMCQYLSVAAALIEKIQEVRVFKRSPKVSSASSS